MYVCTQLHVYCKLSNMESGVTTKQRFPKHKLVLPVNEEEDKSLSADGVFILISDQTRHGPRENKIFDIMHKISLAVFYIIALQ